MFQFIDHPKFPNEYAVCQNTGILKYKKAKARVYGDSYFSDEYKAQYNKTYYEDETNLRQLAAQRLSLLKNFPKSNPSQKPKLLELGSAAGFFLDEARKLGFEVQGFELSEREVAYSVSLGLNVQAKSFLEIPLDSFQNQMDVVAAFFVIEHIAEAELAWQRLAHWVKPGGVLLIAVPCFYGPTFQTNPEDWFRTHPSDHFYDYDKTSLKKLLSGLGFQLNYSRPLSYHPIRDRGILGKLPTKVYKTFADLFSYGDTVQIAAVKKTK